MSAPHKGGHTVFSENPNRLDVGFIIGAAEDVHDVAADLRDLEQAGEEGME